MRRRRFFSCEDGVENARFDSRYEVTSRRAVLSHLDQDRVGAQAVRLSMHRLRLGLLRAAIFGRQCRAANSTSRAVYAGPTRPVVPRPGTRSSRISRFIDIRARFTTVCFASVSASGSDGTLPSGIRRKLWIRGESARSQASTERTAIRNRIIVAGEGSNDGNRSGGQCASWSRSRRTSHGANLAALL